MVLKKSKFDSDSSDLSDSETFADEYGEEGTITSQVDNKRTRFLVFKVQNKIWTFNQNVKQSFVVDVKC